ncbi:MAG: M56 family metallopeptidase [Terracidiphilus sp.]
MPVNASSLVALAGVLCLAALPMARGEAPAVTVQVHMETTGDVSVRAWSRETGLDWGPAVAQVIHCQGRMQTEPDRFDEYHCSNALRRDGLSLEAVVDLAPIAQKLADDDEIQLWLNYPRLRFDSSPAFMEEMGGWGRVSRTARIEAGALPAPIHVRFGYRRDQLAGIYLPLVALALALTLMAAIFSRAALAGLSRYVLLLGTILWMGAASQLQAGMLLRILLFGTPLANLAALLVEFWPPLFCVAAGVALGSRKQAATEPSGKFGEVFWSLAVIPLVLTCAVGALAPMMAENWLVAVAWLAAAPIVVLLRRGWIRAKAGARVRQLGGGELKERVSALAARVGRPQVKVIVSFSARSQVSAAFALPGKSIFLTAPLVRSLSKREVDAVAAHELAHFSHSGRGPWMALGIAMVLFETPVRDALPLLPGGFFVAMLVPLTVLFAALRGARRREFAADASAAALTGDPRAMISSLARVTRNNKIPLDMNAAVEWFSSHPSTRKRIHALAAAASLGTAEVEALCASGDPEDHYEIPPEESGGAIFTPAWQKINAGIYGWTAMLGASGAGLSVAWLCVRYAGAGAAQLAGGIILGCLLTKALAATVMAAAYARLRRKLAAKLGVGGELVGLAIDDVPRLYDGRRFSDAGLLRFEGGRLCYKSERTSIGLNPADVVEVGMVAASPAAWLKEQPMVRFRSPESGEMQAFILHPLRWLATQRRLLRSIQRWRATSASTESTQISGFNRVAGRPARNPTVAGVARAFLVSGGVTLVAAIAAVPIFGAEWRYVAYSLAITACAHTFLFLPSMLYRMPSAPSKLETPAGAK